MKTRFEKTLRITGDVMLYCHHHGAIDFNLRIIELEGKVEYVINASPVTLDSHMLEELTKRLTAPRQREIENEFWELMGESEDFSEITLVGMLCDEAEINYENYTLTITLIRID